MEFNGIVKSFENKSILVTGSTGFLAKLFVEKILRVQPKVKKIYLLIRATDNEAAKERLLREVIEKDLFKVLKMKYGGDLDSFILNKVITLAGDVIYDNFGIQDPKMTENMTKEINIIVNSAANTKFDERYDVLLTVNTFGSKTIIDFAKKCVNLEMLLHVSTAYVCGEQSGVIVEKPLKIGESLNGVMGLDINHEKWVVNQTLKELQANNVSKEAEEQTMKELGMERARIYGWPNTYVFTKAMGEMLLGHMGDDLPLVIVRPTVVMSTYREPFPGWIEGTRHIDILLIGYGKGKLTCFLGDNTLILDMIPGDMVVNAMIVAMATHANETCQRIYHVGSSSKNPLNPYIFTESAYDYFCRNPMTSKDGFPIRVSRPTILTSMAKFYGYLALRYVLPLKVFEILNVLCCNYFHHKCTDMNRKISLVVSLVKLYAPYIYFKGIFDDLNTERLRIEMERSTVEDDTLNFDPKIIDWDDYYSNIHLPGVLKYSLRS